MAAGWRNCTSIGKRPSNANSDRVGEGFFPVPGQEQERARVAGDVQHGRFQERGQRQIDLPRLVPLPAKEPPLGSPRFRRFLAGGRQRNAQVAWFERSSSGAAWWTFCSASGVFPAAPCHVLHRCRFRRWPCGDSVSGWASPCPAGCRAAFRPGVRHPADPLRGRFLRGKNHKESPGRPTEGTTANYTCKRQAMRGAGSLRLGRRI